MGTSCMIKPKDELAWAVSDFALKDAEMGKDGNIYGIYEHEGLSLCVVILISSRAAGAFGFCYKLMEEQMHPYYYDCPKRIYDQLSPLPDAPEWQYARAWREVVSDNLNA